MVRCCFDVSRTRCIVAREKDRWHGKSGGGTREPMASIAENKQSGHGRSSSDLRPYDVVGRYGGEEFLLRLPGCNLVTGTGRAEEIREIVAKHPIVTSAGTTSATVSMGVTVTSLARGCTTAESLQQADLSLYRAKNSGRNRVEVFSKSATPAAAR